ncbi:unnamed protein product, partial [Schistosoma turkestanicum]
MKRQNVRTLSLIVVTFTYLLLGAAIFDALESEFEVSEDMRLRESAESLRTKYNITIDDFERITQLGIQMKPYKAGTQWKFAGAFYFSTTVITTIGYGHSTPKTFGGKIFCMCYALPGIPLCLIMFQSIGERMNTIITYLLKKSNLMCKIHNFISQTHLMIVSFTIGSIVLTIGAMVFSRYEDWDYLDSFYYCFITLTTIGFGDFVALQRNNSLAKRPDYVAFSLIFILFGLTVVSSVMNLLVLRFLTMNTEDEKRDQLEAAVHAQELQRLRGDVICADKQNGLQTSVLLQKQQHQLLQGQEYQGQLLNSYTNNNNNNNLDFQQNIKPTPLSLSNSYRPIKTESSISASRITTLTTTSVTSTTNTSLVNNPHTNDTGHSKHRNVNRFNFCLICLKKFHSFSPSFTSSSSSSSSTPGVFSSSLMTAKDNVHENMSIKPIDTTKITTVETVTTTTTATTATISNNNHDHTCSNNNNNDNNSNHDKNNSFSINSLTQFYTDQSTTINHPFVISSSLYQENCLSEFLTSSNSHQYDLACRNHYIYSDCINPCHYHSYNSFQDSKYFPSMTQQYDCKCTHGKLSDQEYIVSNRQREMTRNEVFDSDNLSENKSNSSNEIELIQPNYHPLSTLKPYTYDITSPDHFSLPGRYNTSNNNNNCEVVSTLVHSSLVAQGSKSHKHIVKNDYIPLPRQSLNSQPPLSSANESMHPMLYSTHHYMDVFKSNHHPLINEFPSEFINLQTFENEIGTNSTPYFHYKRYPRIHQEQQVQINELDDYDEENVFVNDSID